WSRGGRWMGPPPFSIPRSRVWTGCAAAGGSCPRARAGTAGPSCGAPAADRARRLRPHPAALPMSLDSPDRHPGARFLQVFACLVVVTAGLKLAGAILVPFVLAAFLAIVTMPVMFGLR